MLNKISTENRYHFNRNARMSNSAVAVEYTGCRSAGE